MSKNTLDEEMVFSMEVSTTFSRPRSVLVRKVGDEVLLLNCETQTYFSLDEVGATLYDLLESGESLSAALEKMCENYEVDMTTLKKDCCELVQNLVQQALLVTG